MKIYKLTIFLIIIVTFFTGCATTKQDYSTVAKDGVVDLTQWDSGKNESIHLDGEWAFYWDKFLDYNDLQNIKPDAYVSVPDTWNNYELNGTKLPGQGFATYRAHIKTNYPKGTILGLRIYNFSSAYRLYVNDAEIASNGKPGKSADEEIGAYKPQAVFFTVPDNEFDVIIQVSNYHYARGGFWYTIYLGSQQAITQLNATALMKEVFLLGILCIVSIYSITVFLLKRKLKFFLYFTCLCFTMALTFDSVGQFIVMNALPGLKFDHFVLIWYSASIWIGYFIMRYMHELYSSEISKVIVKINLAINAVFQMIFLFTEATFYSHYFARVSDIFNTIGIFLSLWIISIGIKKGQKDGWVSIIGVLIALMAFIHDYLYWINVIHSRFGELVYIGLPLFILSQMIVQAIRYKEFHDNKTLTELKFLQAQIKPHFMYNALNTIISISRYDAERSRSLLISFSNYLRRSFDFKETSQFVPLKNEIELSKAYVEIEKARFEDQLEVYFDLCDNLEQKVPVLMLQPIIENAINHGVLPKSEPGKVEVIVKEEGDFIRFTVKDDGVGIDKTKDAHSINNNVGNGVALINIDRRLKKLYGNGLMINSTKDVGTEVTWCIPVKRKRGKR